MSSPENFLTIPCPDGEITVPMNEAVVWTVSSVDSEQHENPLSSKAFFSKCHSFVLDTRRILLDVKNSLMVAGKKLLNAR